MDTNKVAVIGVGPAGLAAVHAAVGLGYKVDIYGPRVRSKLRGPVMLHNPIPGITMTQPDAYVRQIVIGGSIVDYRRKLYGDVNININGDILEPGFHAWRIHTTYDSMWWRYIESHADGVHFIESEIKLGTLLSMVEQYRLVVSTAPAKQFCVNDGHVWRSKPVALTWDTELPDQPANTVYYNADPSTPWVRSSNLFDSKVTEWPVDKAPEEAHVIYKPLFTDCTCTASVFRTGRYGAWRNQTWVDTAYYDVRTALIENGDGNGIQGSSLSIPRGTEAYL